MKRKQIITLLAILIAVISAITSAYGIFSNDGTGSFTYSTIRGTEVEIYGYGIYKHMSADVAIQGIAQDYVTLCVAVPLLIISLIGYRKESIKSKFILTGTVGYFFVTYLFYTAMGMYNIMFLGYISLLALSFFALFNLLTGFDLNKIRSYFSDKTPTRLVGTFLIINVIGIALLWLGIIVPPLIDGTIYPAELQHYTTLIVQGFDLGLLLPIAFVSGFMLVRKKPMGYLLGTSYIIFLSLLMTALTAKIIAMAINGVNVIPVIIIIPSFNLFAIICLVLLIKNIRDE
jgi:hypothetical protein